MQKAFLALAITLAFISSSEARDDTSVKTNIHWCLIDGRGDVQGRNTMYDAMKNADLGQAEFNFRQGFNACVNWDGTKTRNYIDWETAEADGPLKYGRAITRRLHTRRK